MFYVVFLMATINLLTYTLGRISHCADAILSFANLSTQVGDVSDTVTNFAARWAQTPSGYDTLVAMTMDCDWVLAHLPVISSHKTGHHVYNKFSVARPQGLLIRCHRPECVQPISDRVVDRAVHLICRGCGSTARIPEWKNDQGTALRAAAIVKAVFPLGYYHVEWRQPKMARSTSLPLHTPPPTPIPMPPSLMPSSSKPSSSTTSLLIPPFHSLSRSRSTPAMRDTDGTPTPPPPSPHDPSPAPINRKRPQGEEARAPTKKKLKGAGPRE